MTIRNTWAKPLAAVAGLLGAALSASADDAFRAQNERLLQTLTEVHGLSSGETSALRGIFAQGRYIGQGNPAIVDHPASPEQCRAKLAQQSVNYENPEHASICGDRYMAPLFDPSRESMHDAKACVDKFEFPNVPCEYPVTWVRANEAAEICASVGKRLCDAHEWEGACDGALEPPDYRFDLSAGKGPSAAAKAMRRAHNRKHSPRKKWSYGSQYQKGICGAASRKSQGCEGGGWTRCGSNTYPTGHFPQCRSELDVYDTNGNAAEHMNLPLNESQMASRGSTTLGVTEMKGSWFIFDRYHAHADWCRWRAPFWHGTRVMDSHSHHNYHLGFRCCKTVK